MDNNVVHYSSILKEGEGPKQDNIVVEFSCFNSKFLVKDQYCFNPGCDCTNVLLTFIELSGDGIPLNDWFSIKLDIFTWEVKEKKLFNKMINIHEMIDEFLKNIEEHKGKIHAHFIMAKQYGGEHYLDYVPESMVKVIQKGETVLYSKIFGSKDIEKFSFEFNETEKYIIDDQYCANPKCSCNEAILAFYRDVTSKGPQKPEFAISVNLKNQKYKIDYKQCDVDKIADIMKYLQRNKPETLSILKSRYLEMKNAGKEIMKKYEIKEPREEQLKEKVGRNDACPCGSGKKYKKCCGN